MEVSIQELAQLYPPLRDAIKDFFANYNLSFIWDGIRDTILNPHLLLLQLLPCLLLERFYKNATPHQFPTVNLAYDLVFNVMNGIFMASFILYFTQLTWSLYTTWLPGFNLRLLDDQAAWIQVAGAFIVRDFTFYASHWARHKVPWLWYFHSIHHNQKVLTPATTLRLHPVDMLCGGFISLLPIMIVGGTYETFVAFNFLIYTWRFFVHTNVKIQFGWLNYLVVSPQFHRVHHSSVEKHFDANYGEWLSVWDFIFGTAVKDFNAYPKTGVADVPELEEHSYRIDHLVGLWFKHMLYPFGKIAESVSKSVLVARTRTS